MSDCFDGRVGCHHDSVDRILGKFYYRLTEAELDEVKDTFWTEFEQFATKTGQFGEGRKYIWNSDLIRKRKSAKWHAQYSLTFTEVSFSLVLFDRKTAAH